MKKYRVYFRDFESVIVLASGHLEAMEIAKKRYHKIPHSWVLCY